HPGVEKEEEIGANFNGSLCCLHVVHYRGGCDAAAPVCSGPVVLVHHQDWSDFPPDVSCIHTRIVYDVAVIRRWHENGRDWRIGSFSESSQSYREIDRRRVHCTSPGNGMIWIGALSRDCRIDLGFPGFRYKAECLDQRSTQRRATKFTGPAAIW